MSSLIPAVALPVISPRPDAAAKTFLTGLKRGFRRHCPNCDQGHLFDGYLTVRPTCEVCGNDNSQYRADDGPAYFTILIVGHVVVAPLFALSVVGAWSPWMLLALGLPLVAAATLAFLPFIKGGWIGVLWATTTVDEPAST
jgi:uncharacterized protein (DUF983 family)